MRARSITFVAVLVLFPQLSALADGSANLITYGPNNNPGLEANAQGFEPTGSGSSRPVRLSVQSGGVTLTENIDTSGVINNRCSAANLGDGFSYSFADGVECASFAAPGSEQVVKKGKKRRPPSPEQVALALADRAIALAPDPRLEVAPGRVGLTGLESFFWLSDPPAPIRATAAAGPVTVTAEARPTQFVWDFDDGSDKVTYNPGRRWTKWREGSIGHLYETSGRYDLSVDVVWEARWRIGGGTWRHLGYFTTSDSRRYPVREVIAMLIRPGWRAR